MGPSVRFDSTQEVRSTRTAQLVLARPETKHLFYLKLQWISAKDDDLKADLSEKIRELLTQPK